MTKDQMVVMSCIDIKVCLYFRSSYSVYYRVLFSELIEAMKGIPPVKQSDLIDVSHLYTITSVLPYPHKLPFTQICTNTKSTSWIPKFLARLWSPRKK